MSWVGFGGFEILWPKPNPTHMGWVESMGWTNLLLLLLLLNLVEKNININILKKPKN